MLQINTNSNIDDYKETVIAGMTARETLWAGAGIIAGALVTVISAVVLHLPLILCIYLGIPAIIPFVLTGFSIKDGMTFWQRWRRNRNKKKSSPLSYCSTECRSSYQKRERKLELSEEDKNKEFERLLKHMKVMGVLLALAFIVGIIIFIIVWKR